MVNKVRIDKHLPKYMSGNGGTVNYIAGGQQYWVSHQCTHDGVEEVIGYIRQLLLRRLLPLRQPLRDEHNLVRIKVIVSLIRSQ